MVGLNSIVFALALNCPTLDVGYSRVENERVFPNLYESAHIEGTCECTKNRQKRVIFVLL